MTERSLVHSTINLERTYKAPPSAVFAAWSSSERLEKWAVPGEGMTLTYQVYEFRPGGREVNTFTMEDGSTIRTEAVFGDVVENNRFTSLFTMSAGDTRICSGLISVELLAHDEGCLLRLTEQGVFYDGLEEPANHKLGYEAMLQQLSDHLGG